MEDDELKKLKAELERIRRYVEGTLAGDRDKIKSAGFEVVSPPGASPLGQVRDVLATQGDQTGSVDVVWQPERGATGYEVQSCCDGDFKNWTSETTCTRPCATLYDFASGKRVFVRVRALGVNDKGGWSDPAETVVP
jgi:hypothetical protein